MKIGIDVSGLFWKYKTGVQILYYGLVEGLAGLSAPDGPEDYVFIDRSGQPGHELPFGGDHRFQLRSPVPCPLLPTFAGPPPAGALKYPVRYWNSSVRELRKFLANRDGRVRALLDDLDVLQVWNWDIRTAARARHIITVPDVIPLVSPEFFPQQLIDETEKSIRFARDTADHVIAISEFTRQDMVEKFAIDADKVSVVYPGLRTFFRPVADKALIDAARRRYGIGEGPYMISIGFLDPRKNVEGHLQAFNELAADPRFRDLRFVLVGPESLATSRMLADIRSMAVRERIHVTGYVPDEDLVLLLNGADAFVYCSHYEGFGFPVIEAMACGIPVVTSNSTSLREIAADAALLVSPTESGEIAEAVRRILTDRELRDRLVARGLDHSRRFTWQAWAQGHLRAYRGDR